MCLVLMRCLYCGVRIGTAEDVDRFSRRTVRVTREHNAECQRLLRLMGIPVVVVRPATSTIVVYRANIRCCPFSVTAGSIRSGGAVCRACTRREGAFRLSHSSPFSRTLRTVQQAQLAGFEPNLPHFVARISEYYALVHRFQSLTSPSCFAV